MVDVHVMKPLPPYGAFLMHIGLSLMYLSCPIAGNSPPLSLVRTSVRVTRP